MANPKQAKQKQQAIIIESAYQGGIADSPYAGPKNSLYSIVGFDLHSVPGVMIVAQKMTKESGAPTDDYYKILACSDGNIYLFGKTNGKVYKNASGTYSLLGTVSPAAGNVGILDAVEWNGKIYYAMQNRLGQWDFTGAFSGRNDNFQTFSVGNASYHPLYILNEVLYCGDGTNVAQFDGTNFTGNALVLKAPQIISCLGKQVTDLLIGTIINNVSLSWVYDWNTYSISYSNAYPIPENGINAFLQVADTDVAVQAGLSGNIYTLNGATFTLNKQIPSNFPTIYSPSNTCRVNYPAVALLNGIPIFGMSNNAGDPCLEGIYSYGSKIMPNSILTLPYPISTGNLNGLTIWSLMVTAGLIYCSSYDSNTGTYQIDKLDVNNKYNGAYYETRLIKFSRIWLDNYDKVVQSYENLPTGTMINIFYDANWVGYVQYNSPKEIWNDSDRNEVVAVLAPRAKTMRFKVQTTAVGNTAPSLEDMIILPT